MNVHNVKSVKHFDELAGRRVAMRRLVKRMSQEELGRRCGVTFQQIQKYESGANRISVSRLHQIAEALECHPIELLGEAAQPPHGVSDEMLVLGLMCDPHLRPVLTGLSRMTQRQRVALSEVIRSMVGEATP